MKPFVYDEVINDGIVDESIPLCTRKGEPARIICTNLKGNYPIAVAITSNNCEILTSVNVKGKYGYDSEHELDLFIDDSIIDLDKPVKTREGNLARIICKNRIDQEAPVVALIYDNNTKNEIILCYTIKGRRYNNKISPLDLVNYEEEK